MLGLFGPFGKKQRRLKVRNALFGDLPASQWPNSKMPTDSEPWRSFVEATALRRAGQREQAIAVYRAILAMPDLESRHYLQAWTFLREMDVVPEEETAKRVYGVIFEATVAEGLDIIAAYADGRARYFDHGGKGIVWDATDTSLAAKVTNMLEAGQLVAAQIDVWDGPRPEAPPTGQARVSILTPSGLHFGQAASEILAESPLGKTVITAATQLVQALVAKAKGGSENPNDAAV
jgi:hypothetical protein